MINESMNYLLDQLVGKNSGIINIISGPAQSGKSSFLYELFHFYSKKYKVALITNEFSNYMNYAETFFPEENLNQHIYGEYYLNVHQDRIKEYDFLLIDNIEHNDTLHLPNSNLQTFLREFNNNIIMTSNSRVSNSTSTRELNYIRQLATNIIQIYLGKEIGERNIRVIKSGFSIELKDFVFKTKSENQMFRFLHSEIIENKFFGYNSVKILSNYLFPSLIDEIDNKNFDEYFENLSFKRKLKIKKILNIDNPNSINFSFLNILYVIKKSYKEFNIDDFLTQEILLSKGINSRIDGIDKQAEHLLISFLQRTLSYEKAKNLIKKYYIDDSLEQKAGIKLLIAIGLSQWEIESNIKRLEKVGRDYKLIQDLINPKKINKKSLYDILTNYNYVINYSRILMEGSNYDFISIKQKEFYEKNKKDYSDFKFNVPVSVSEIINGAVIFNNCTGRKFFIEDFSKNNTKLFYLTHNSINYCVHINEDNSIIEFKKVNNINLTNEERELVNNFIKELN